MRKCGLLFLLLPFTAIGQFFDSLQFQTIDFDLRVTSDEVKEQTFSEAAPQFNFGSVLSSPPGDTVAWLGKIENVSFGISFYLISRDTLYERHRVFFSLVNQTINTNWYQWDDQNSTGSLDGTYGYFQLGLGYSYALVNRKFIKIRPAIRTGFSIPISGTHTEETANGNRRYFSSKKGGFSLDIPIWIEIRLIKLSYFKIGPTWGVGFFDFDGYKTGMSLNGIVLGLKFRL